MRILAAIQNVALSGHGMWIEMLVFQLTNRVILVYASFRRGIPRAHGYWSSDTPSPDPCTLLLRECLVRFELERMTSARLDRTILNVTDGVFIWIARFWYNICARIPVCSPVLSDYATPFDYQVLHFLSQTDRRACH
jgi:hypothetical protein